MKKCKRYGVLIMGVLLIALAVWVVSNLNVNKRLSDEQIVELRKDYPVYGMNANGNDNFDFDILSAVCEEHVQTFIYCEIVSDASVDYPSFHAEYKVKVLKDTEKLYSEQEEIIIVGSTDEEYILPVFSKGMKIVLPIWRDDDGRRHWYSIVGTYWVTDDEYVLSAFNEGKYSQCDFTGTQLAQLWKELEKIK